MQGQKCRLAALRITEQVNREKLDSNCAVKVGENLRTIQKASDLCIKYPILEDISTTALEPLTRKKNLDVQASAVKEVAKLLKSKWNDTLKTYRSSRSGGSPVSENEVKKIINDLKGKKEESFILRVGIRAANAYRVDTPIDDDINICTFITYGG